MHKKLIICVLLGVYTFFAPLRAQEYRIRNITNTDGLSNSSVNTVFQDRSGLLWFGTWDGLNSYNGQDFHVYLPAPGDSTSLDNNVIRQMAQSADGTLWIATDRGVNSFSAQEGLFRRHFSGSMHGTAVSEFSFHLLTSPDGEIGCVVSGHGVFRYHANGSFTRTAPPPGRRVLQAVMDKARRVWVLSDEGNLYCNGIVRETGIRFFFYDTEKDHFWVQDDRSYHLLGTKTAKSWNIGPIRAAATDGTYQYLGTGEGLYRYAPLDGSLTLILPDVPVLSVCCGSQRIIWVGSDMQGIWQLSPRPFDFGAVSSLFGASAVRCFSRSANGDLAVGTKGAGIFILTRERTAKHITTEQGLLHNNVYCLEDDGEAVWIGTDGNGLNYWEKGSRKMQALQFPDSLILSSVYALLPEGKDSLWVGTSGNGLFRLLLNRNVRPYQVKGFTHYPHLQLGSDVVYSLLPTWNGHLFVGTRGGGLRIVDKHTGQVFPARPELPDDILCLRRASDGALLAGTSSGLFRFGDSWEEISRYSRENGLPSNTIHGILEDARGHIWASTNNGLARIDLASGQVTTYQAEDGLQDNEFSDGAFYESDGDFFFGGIRGFNWFDPLTVAPATFMPSPLLDEIRIDNETAHLRQETLVLNPHVRQLSFRFAPLDYLWAKRCWISYSLDGFTPGWVNIQDSRTISFSNLPPGEYTLRVRCSNGDRIWSDEMYVLPIRKMPEWWETPFARVMYVLLGLLIIGLLVRQARYRFQVEAEKSKTEAVHEAKLDFFTNIAHEFSNSLTLIYGPCEELMQSGRMDGKERQYLESIETNSNRMRTLIQQLISFRKAETGHLSIQIGEVDLLALTAQERSYFQDEMVRRGIHFQLDAPEDGLIWTADGDSMEKLLFNLLSNAVKYTPDGERITVSLIPDDHWLDIKVTNTGVGIAEEQRLKIFDRYEVLNRFERALSKGRTSSGIGLALCKSLVELHNGSIEILSDGQNFTCFHVRLPRLEVKETGAPYTGKGTLAPIISEHPKPAEEAPVSTYKQDVVLVVDDDASIRNFISGILSPRFSVLEAASGEDALERMSQTEPRIIISDLKMPGMDGAMLLKTLRENPKTRHIPFILLSGQGTADTPFEALETGADAYLEKPFHPRHLLARIDRLLGRDAEVIAYSQSGRSSVEQFAGREMKKADRQLLAAVSEVIVENLASDSLSPDSIADAVSISRMQLYRKLKELTGMTPTGFIRQMRLERAAHLLKSSNKTVQEIMFACGFSTKTYFYREFSKQFGVTPGEYRGSEKV